MMCNHDQKAYFHLPVLQKRLESLINDEFKNEIHKAKIVDSKKIPNDFIALNSKFILKDPD